MAMMTLEEHNQRKARSNKLLLWFAMISMVMMFAGLTSAYVVSTSRPDWVNDFKLPQAFWMSTGVMLLSSLTFLWSRLELRKGQMNNAGLGLVVTLALGFLFVFLQFYGFNQIIASGYYFTGSESTVTTSFLYIVTVLHLLHLAGGIVALTVTVVKFFRGKYTPESHLGVELAELFWHFLDLLWVLLFLFFYFY